MVLVPEVVVVPPHVYTEAVIVGYVMMTAPVVPFCPVLPPLPLAEPPIP